ncbi:hypothetical protein HMPREF1551_00209 [Capnocytophaga sp. oral taxon 863 str. F0517]|nr:hypothetical protein HMPREF1551_00209 [Capnocytophaga sp. oral taxon 863 str. F0517]
MDFVRMMLLLISGCKITSFKRIKEIFCLLEKKFLLLRDL